MNDAVLLDRLCRVVADVVGAARLPADASAETTLGDGGVWLDSVELLQVVLAAEAEFGVVFEPGEDLVGDQLQTLGALVELIQRRRAAQRAAVSVASPRSTGR